ncbi:hypothetical protein [Brevibacillus migulae]|uniref:hypothetical protein n=1 Tax=Brevibacillus migulae TaxID=1644114 RepID=UPI00143061BF|nr:hypothetical protein [Brevibacillus migulae]
MSGYPQNGDGNEYDDGTAWEGLAITQEQLNHVYMAGTMDDRLNLSGLSAMTKEHSS